MIFYIIILTIGNENLYFVVEFYDLYYYVISYVFILPLNVMEINSNLKYI